MLLRGLDRSHPQYGVVRMAIVALRRKGNVLCLMPQNLIEFWAVATRPVQSNGLGMDTQWSAAQFTRLKRFFTILPDTPELFPEWERLVIQYRVSGKSTHDARLVASMNVHSVTHILTYNQADFSRYQGITVIDPPAVVVG